MADAPVLQPEPRFARHSARGQLMSRERLLVIRILTLLSVFSGLIYLTWRWCFSVDWHNWWISIPLVAAETYSLIGTALLGAQIWRVKFRGRAPHPPEDATADVFICTYNEDLDLVATTAHAAKSITWPHNTYILDDGARDEMRALAEDLGVRYITRTDDWRGKKRHAKAGNLNNALMQTTGEFILILDADQVPKPQILTNVLGWFNDPEIGIVQTPQWFYNVAPADPLSNQQSLFYGPVQQGKDGWDAAFFCGTNGVLRREALMHLGVHQYVHATEGSVREALKASRRILRNAQKDAPVELGATERMALIQMGQAADDALRGLNAGEPVQTVTWDFQERVRLANASLISSDLASIQADLADLAALGLDQPSPATVAPAALAQLDSMQFSPLAAMQQVTTLVRTIDVDRSDEALPVNPVSSTSVTEDMETSMLLHSIGWRSVFHGEILCRGMATEDLESYLTQRLRWAQGNMQVLIRDNPLTFKGLRPGQRLSYFSMLWDYLTGFPALIFLATPIVYLLTGAMPVTSWGWHFVAMFVPYFVISQAQVFLVGLRVNTWRNQQYSLAMFPTWIKACVTAAANVWFGRPLSFAVTDKQRPARPARFPVRLVWPQLTFMLLMVAAVVGGFCFVHYSADMPLGPRLSWLGWAINTTWITFYFIELSAIIRGARFRMPEYDFRSILAGLG